MADEDFLRELGNWAVVTRMKRICDVMIHDGRRMYKELGMDIEPNWFVIFKLLEKHGELGVMEIAEKIGFAHPSVISIVNGMIKKGYLEESRSDGDSRRRMLALSAKARRQMPGFERVWRAAGGGVKRMTADIDLLSVLKTLEDRLADTGFKRRTLAELQSESSVEIIEFDERFAADFGRINYAWIEQNYTVEEHDHEILDHPFEAVVRPGGQIFFALVDGAAAGTVALIPMGENDLELTKMGVDAGFRGLGLGDKLMAECIAYGRRMGKRALVLESNTKQAAAINLYRKFGFVEIPLDPNSEYVRANIRMELVL